MCRTGNTLFSYSLKLATQQIQIVIVVMVMKIKEGDGFIVGFRSEKKEYAWDAVNTLEAQRPIL